MERMADFERDTTQDWQLPERSRPPLIGELVERIDEALATARASEAAVMTVGAAALDAAEQAHRAADLAERASAVVFSGRSPVGVAGGGPPAADSLAAPGTPEDEGLRDFTARADRVAARLRELERLPLVAAS
jgi:hypothetical protein